MVHQAMQSAEPMQVSAPAIAWASRLQRGNNDRGTTPTHNAWLTCEPRLVPCERPARFQFPIPGRVAFAAAVAGSWLMTNAATGWPLAFENLVKQARLSERTPRLYSASAWRGLCASARSYSTMPSARHLELGAQVRDRIGRLLCGSSLGSKQVPSGRSEELYTSAAEAFARRSLVTCVTSTWL